MNNSILKADINNEDNLDQIYNVFDKISDLKTLFVDLNELPTINELENLNLDNKENWDKYKIFLLWLDENLVNMNNVLNNNKINELKSYIRKIFKEKGDV